MASASRSPRSGPSRSASDSKRSPSEAATAARDPFSSGLQVAGAADLLAEALSALRDRADAVSSGRSETSAADPLTRQAHHEQVAEALRGLCDRVLGLTAFL